jgi:pimeloyl-ACP methyl ester carboxylesterase
MNDETLILLPSPLVLPYSYHFLKKRLEKKFHLIIPKMPQSSTWSESEYSEWLFTLMKKSHIEKCFLLGHSNSGAIAIWFAKRHPEKIKGVILVDTIGVSEISYPKILLGRLIDAFIEWKLTLWGFHHLIWNFIFHMPNFLFQIKESAKTDILQVASEIKVPALILWGRRDHTIPLTHAQKLRSRISGSELYISEVGSHDWIITNADEAEEVLKKWTLEISERDQASEDYYCL